MSPLPQRLLLSTLVTLLLLAAPSARADLPHETFYLTREEISDEALRGVIGIALIRSMLGPDEQRTDSVPGFMLRGDTFEPDGMIALKHTRAISGWDWDGQSLRKFPVLERRGGYLHVVIDAHTNERTWLRETDNSKHGANVAFLSFDSKEWAWSGIELFFLAPQGETRLYGAPRPDARAHPLSESYPLRIRGEIVPDVRIMGTQGNFLQLGNLISLDEPLDPVGWVPITDENGLLLIWPVFAPMC